MKAGVATRDINPSKPMFLVGYPHVERLSTGVHDPLLVAALCLDNDIERLVLITIDILFIDIPTARKLRESVAERLNIKQDNVFISCTHTHSAPVTSKLLAWRPDPVVPDPDPDYMRMFCARVVEAAVGASKSMKEALLAWTTADGKGVGGNRLSRNGLSDAEVGVMAVRELESNRLMALSVTYSMHPTVLHEDSTLASADFPGCARQYLQDQLGQNVTILYHTGPCGNQSPRYFVNGQTFAEAKRLGEILGTTILDSIHKLADKDFIANPKLMGAMVHTELPTRRYPSVEHAEEQLTLAINNYEQLKAACCEHGIVRTAECATFGAEELVALAKAQDRGEVQTMLGEMLPVAVQVLRIGDTCLAGLPGEVFVEYGLAIKSRANLKTFVVSLVNGHLEGYIVSPEADAVGGYEASVSLFKPEAGTLLVNKALELIDQSSHQVS